jgi:succinate-acetate transporter protein
MTREFFCRLVKKAIALVAFGAWWLALCTAFVPLWPAFLAHRFVRRNGVALWLGLSLIAWALCAWTLRRAAA